MRKDYIRDGRAPIPKKESTSRVMSANKAKNTKPELRLRKALWNFGLRGYRLHPKGITGRPDLVFRRYGLAVFVNGCYWHRCPKCNPSLPKSNVHFWEGKFKKNQERDKRKVRELEQQGWRTVTIWECEINKELHKCVQKINDKIIEE